MPHSSHENKSLVQSWYRTNKPNTVVDIGPGAGTYAQLLRPIHKGRWTAIEAWAPYVNEFSLNNLYDNVVISDVRYVDLNKVHEAPDLVIAGDVIEHLDHKEAVELISRLKTWSKNVIVSVPIIHWEQGSYEGNWFETHKYHWSFEEMREIMGDDSVAHRGKTLGYFFWSN